MYLQWSQRASGVGAGPYVAAFFDKPQIFIVNRPPSGRSYSRFLAGENRRWCVYSSAWSYAGG